MTDIDTIPVANLVVDPVNPRPDPGNILELADSIRDIGVVVPPVVRPRDGGVWGVLSGSRRLAAAVYLDLEALTCIIRRPATDTEALLIATADNVGRKAMNPIEEARSFRRLLDEFGCTQLDLARRLGTSDYTVSVRLQLLTLPDDLQAAIAAGEMTVSRAYKQLRDARPRTGRNAPRRRGDAPAGGKPRNFDLDEGVLARAQAAAVVRHELVEDLIARAVRRELAQPSCRRCERRPVLPSIGNGQYCGPGCPGKDAR